MVETESTDGDRMALPARCGGVRRAGTGDRGALSYLPAVFGGDRTVAGYERHLRADGNRLILIWIVRVRCRVCAVTQALLPWFVVPFLTLALGSSWPL